MTTTQTINARSWNIQAAASSLSRFDFVAVFVARMTRTKTGREPVCGFRVVLTRDGWTYTLNGVQLTAPTTDTGVLFDVIRRTPLGHYTRQADEFRCDALS